MAIVIKRQMKKIDKLPISVSLVIPVFNDAKSIYKQLRACLGIMDKFCKTYGVIVSNDASYDSTRDILENNFRKIKQVTIFNQSKNLGISRNIRFLYEKARFDYVLLFSVDGAWNTNDIGRLINAAYDSHADIVIGERQKKAYSLSRIIISSIYNSLSHILFGVKTYDAGSIKIFKKGLFMKLNIQSKSVFFETEMIIKATKRLYKTHRIHVTHKAISKRKSGVNKTLIFSSFLDMLRLRLRGVQS